MHSRFFLLGAVGSLLLAPLAQAQFELKGGASNLLDKRLAGASPTVSSDGTITGITVRGGGKGYTSAPAVTIAAPLNGGVTAMATATVTDEVVTLITIVNGGSKYDASQPPEVVIAPPKVPSSPPVTNVQFAGLGSTAASAGAISVQGITAGRYPRAVETINGVDIPVIVLQRATFGFAFASGVPRYFMGDIITPPVLDFKGAPLTQPNYWRSQPVQPGESFDSVTLDYTVDGLTQPLLSAGLVTVTSSQTTSKVVEIASLPPALTTGATLLGREVHMINGTTLTLSGEANANTVSDTSTSYLPYQPYYYSRHADKVFATQTGRVSVTWVSNVPDTTHSGTTPTYKFRRETFAVSSASQVAPRVIFWTKSTFDGPKVDIASPIVRVNPIYNSFVPGQAPEYTPVGSSSGNNSGGTVENRTLWFETEAGPPSLQAYNAEGRVFVEYLGPEIQGQAGTHQFIGADVVQITRSADVETIATALGERLRPREGLTKEGDDEMFPVLPQGAFTSGKSSYGSFIKPDGSTDYSAERENLQPDKVVFYWMRDQGASLHSIAGGAVAKVKISWPVLKRNYLFEWPVSLADYELVNVTSTGADATLGPKFAATSLPLLVYQDDPDELEAEIEGASQRLLVDFSSSSDKLNRSLLKFSSLAGPQYVRLWIQSEDLLGSPAVVDDPATTNINEFRDAIYTINDRNADGVRDWSSSLLSHGLPVGGRTAATVGSRLVAPAGHEVAGHISAGTCYSALAYLDPLGSGGITGGAAGAIIPVNALSVDKTLSVWWFKKVSFPSATKVDPFYVPATAAHYEVNWPSDPEKLVIASLKGLEGSLTSAQASGSLYRQPDSSLPGYNPNEEHAMLQQGNIYALRVDLNEATSSEPFVLLQYTDPSDNRPAMRVAEVLDVYDPYLLTYNKIAGTPMTPPVPLAFLPLPMDSDGSGGFKVANEEVQTSSEVLPVSLTTVDYSNLVATDRADGGPSYEAFTVEDRKGQHWLFRGPHADINPSPTFGMRFYYYNLAHFDFPSGTAPAVGAIQPFIRDVGAGKSEVLTYSPVWPDDLALPEGQKSEVPALATGETLGQAKNTLPQVLGQTSAQILYQQSMAAAGENSPAVLLHDPLRAKTTLLDSNSFEKLPATVLTNDYAGRTYFQKVAPHLQHRFYYDRNLGSNGGLVLEGEFVDEVLTEDYFNLNVLSAEDLEALQDLCADADPDKTAWDNAIAGLSTQLETFSEDLDVPGSYVIDATKDSRIIYQDALVEITDPDTAVVGYALSSPGSGTGYVTLMFGNGQAFTDPADPVTMEIIKVNGNLYPGDLKVLLASNPLDEKVTLRHSGDYGAKPENFEFRYGYAFNNSRGQAPSLPLDNSNIGLSTEFPDWLNPDHTPYSLGGSILVGADPSAVLSTPAVLMGDVNFTMSYRLKATSNSAAGDWSVWTRPALVEGWIKRVLAGINPFNQRMTDLYGNSIDTDVSMITQAGTAWEGNIALNMDNINDVGLIAIYETVLNRGKSFTINSDIDTDSTNQALTLAAGYLNDLYNILGNEAYADAANPTISIDDSDSVTEVNTSRFAFEGQVSSSLAEELALLRGRDDFAAPGTSLAPVYNRLFPNYTRGINAGEALYAVNYNILEKEGSSTADGILDAADAQRMFPQGHGDARGHYLTALKGYYKLLIHPYFTWRPSAETVTVLGVAVSVDYMDERKFAASAVNLAVTDQQILGLIHRQSYRDDPAAGWAHFRDGKVNPSNKVARHQGLDESASRATQGAFYHWIVGNAMLPDVDNNSAHTGVQIVDRTTVLELPELPVLALSFQTTMDSANGGLNPLKLSPQAIAFDLDPYFNNSLGSGIAGGVRGASHYEQVSARALQALNNAAGAFHQAATMTRLLRNQENQISEQQTAIEDEEYASFLELREIYGSPYAGDIGPGKTYPQGYAEPDYYKWYIIDQPLDWVPNIDDTTTVKFQMPVVTPVFSGVHASDEIISYEMSLAEQTFDIIPNQLAQFAAADQGKRSYTGALQDALVEAQLAQINLLAANDDLIDLQHRFDREKEVLQGLIEMHKDQMSEVRNLGEDIIIVNTARATIESLASQIEAWGDSAVLSADSISEALPTSVGASVDTTSIGRSAAKATAASTAYGAMTTANMLNYRASLFEADGVGRLELGLTTSLMKLEFAQEELQASYEFEQTLRQLISGYNHFAVLARNYATATEKIANLMVKGDTLQLRRATLRQRAAAVINGYRTKDLTFRTFRNEALVQYRTLFDLAGQYSYLSAKSYDYETGLLGTASGQTVINRIVASRSLGDLTDGVPQATTSTLGDAGLAGTMAQLNADFAVAEGRLGINNPDHYNTLFSLRQELYRLLPYVEGGPDVANQAWQQTLEQSMVSDLLADADVAIHCRGLAQADGSAVPGIIISFSTTVEDGKNFFGLPLAAGDHAYSQSSFSTKIAAVGLAFQGYKGINDGESTEANALGATPYAYLIPCGSDFLRSPLGDVDDIRSWQVVDQALPLPYNLGANDFNTIQFFGANDTLSEQPWVIRKHQAFRAVSDPSLFEAGHLPLVYTNRRLIGRSVWNSHWKIVIPANTLLNDEQQGLSNFAASVQDIKLFVRTYSNSGN